MADLAHHFTSHPLPKASAMRDNIIARLIVYYVVGVILIGGMAHAIPAIPRYIAQERARVAHTTETQPADVSAAQEAPEAASSSAFELLTPARSLPVVVSLTTAFLVALPVTWVYRWTRPRKRYSQAFAQTLLLVPIGIALVVFLVKGSLALAFSLTGIVAAVRFRTTLEDSLDAVYMFIVIGAGLAAGVQLLAIAFIASIIFNATALTVWKLNYGAEAPVISGWRIVNPRAGDAPATGGASKTEVAAVGGPAKSPYNATLRVQTTQVEAARRAAVPILQAGTKQWQVANVTHLEDGTSVLEFDVRLKKSTDLAAFIREIEKSDGGRIGKVELKRHKPDKE